MPEMPIMCMYLLVFLRGTAAYEHVSKPATGKYRRLDSTQATFVVIKCQRPEKMSEVNDQK